MGSALIQSSLKEVWSAFVYPPSRYIAVRPGLELHYLEEWGGHKNGGVILDLKPCSKSTCGRESIKKYWKILSTIHRPWNRWTRVLGQVLIHEKCVDCPVTEHAKQVVAAMMTCWRGITSSREELENLLYFDNRSIN